jgi:hypothetical protein
VSNQHDNAASGQPAPITPAAVRESLYDVCKRYSAVLPPEALREIMKAVDQLEQCARQRVDMVLFCPSCGTQHIDGPECGFEYDTDGRPIGELRGWTDPPHLSHLCRNSACRHVWRPADVVTNGVAQIRTHGKDDSPPALPMGKQFEATDSMTPAEVRAIREHNQALYRVMELRPMLAKILNASSGVPR